MSKFVSAIVWGIFVLIGALIGVWLLFSLLSSFGYMHLVRGAVLLTGVASLVIGVILGSQTRLAWGLGLIGLGALTLAATLFAGLDWSGLGLGELRTPQDVSDRVLEHSPFFGLPVVLTGLLCAVVLGAMATMKGVDRGKVVVAVVAMLSVAALLFFTSAG